MRRSEAMAEAGDVDGSMVCAQQAETYKKQHETLHTSLTAPERVMTVCEVCGVFINSTDNDQRRQVRKPMSEVSAEQRYLQASFPSPASARCLKRRPSIGGCLHDPRVICEC